MGILALTRRVGEEVVIGDPAHPLGLVRVVDIQGDKVKLAFRFPRDLQVNRSELAEQKLKARQDENGGTPPPTTQPGDAQHGIKADRDGIVLTLTVQPGDAIKADDVIAVVQNKTS